MLSDWKDLFDLVKRKEYSNVLNEFLKNEYESFVVYPPKSLQFNAFKLTKPEDIKVVIIGQDPYHEPNQAMGLSFSVPKGIPLPPSLKNIYKEIEDDLHIKMNFSSGDLTPWAKQGVLLLNAYLSVRKGEPLSHKCKEYEEFMKDTIEFLEKLNQPIVYLLWGSFAQKVERYIVNEKHLILEANHPSPLSANRGGWFGTKSFSKCNKFLIQNKVKPIDWKN